MTGYHDHTDLTHLADLKDAAPHEFAAWAGLDQIVAHEHGQIPRKYRELIALAVAHTTQCVYCLDAHTGGAARAGATRGEVAEAALLAAALRAGGAAAHGALSMKLFAQHTGDDAAAVAENAREAS